MLRTMLSQRERAVPIKLNATRITPIDEASMHQELLGLRTALARERAALNATSQALLRERSLTRALPKLQGQLRQAHAQLVRAGHAVWKGISFSKHERTFLSRAVIFFILSKRLSARSRESPSNGAANHG